MAGPSVVGKDDSQAPVSWARATVNGQSSMPQVLFSGGTYSVTLRVVSRHREGAAGYT